MKQKNKIKHKQIEVIDLFCGIGGLSYGLFKEGFSIKAGIDINETCKYAFETNCKSEFIHEDISEIKKYKLKKLFKKNSVKILVGCAPCQPFSLYTCKHDKTKDKRWQLLYKFTEFINEIKPEIISMENVPRLANFKKAPVFDDFINNLKQQGYNVDYKFVYCPDYGMPQKRKRLVLLASKLGKISLIPPTHSKENYFTVRDAIGNMEKLKSGEISKTDFIHKANRLSELNLARIRQSKPGGSWKRDWDDNLKLKCHKIKKGETYVSVYGRMIWDEPSPTMTTFCTGIGNGRFGHPEQDRAISLREAAILQTFPKKYKFAKNAKTLKSSFVAKQIGNAVPPKLGRIIGKSIKLHLKEVMENEKTN